MMPQRGCFYKLQTYIPHSHADALRSAYEEAVSYTHLDVYKRQPEDFALCEFVDTSKMELHHIVRQGLDLLYKAVSYTHLLAKRTSLL